MKNSYTKEKVVRHKTSALMRINNYIDSNINNGKSNLIKADKFSYWLEDYIKFLEYENKFNPKKLKKYKRGEIIKVHLGYNIGSEEGGLHYAVVLDKDNSINSPVLTIIPLTSVKAQTNLKRLKRGSVYIGDELYKTLNNKMANAQTKEADRVNREIQKMKTGSIALINQITTVSKMRIYDPKHSRDVLSGVKLSDSSLNMIDKKIKELFIK